MRIEKIFSKLFNLNKTMNQGKELLVTHFIERIDPKSNFMKEYRH